MSIIAVTPPATLTPEQIAYNAMRAKTELLNLAATNILTTLTNSRSTGAQVIYGDGIAAANSLLATQPKGGAKLVLADILARKLADVYDPQAVASASPVPAGIALSVQGVDVVKFMADLDALVSQFLADARGVELNEPNS